MVKDLFSFSTHSRAALELLSAFAWICFVVGLISIPITLKAQSANTSNSVIYKGLNNPSSLDVAQNGIYIVEQGQNRILKLSLNGELLNTQGNKGSGSYQFDMPLDINATNGLKVYISDFRNRRIQTFDKRWQLLSTLDKGYGATSRSVIEPSWLSVNKLGELIFFDERSKYFMRFDEFGTYMDQFPLPGEILQIDGFQVSDGELYILDQKKGVVHILSTNGFYESFYPLNVKVSSFFVDGNTWYFGVGNQIYRDGLETENQLKIDLKENIRRICVYKDWIYLLTATEVHRLKVVR